MKKEEVLKIVGNEGLSKSKKMVLLYEGGLELKEIKEHMGVSSNFVYNVISEYCRMNDVELRVVKKVKSGVGKEEIEKLLLEGKEVVEISGMLKVRSNYIYKVRKELRDAGKMK
jgi:transposase